METTKFVLDNLLIFLNTTLISHASIYENNVNQSLPNTAMNMQSPCEIGQTYLGKTICIAEDYQTNKPPNGNIIPIFYIFEDINIFKINEKDKVIELEMKVGKAWTDERIKANFSAATNRNFEFFFWYEKKELPIWLPRGTRLRYIQRMKQSHEPATLVIIGRNNSTRMPSATWVISYHELQVSVHCDFQFTQFPMDTQSCQILDTNENNRDLKLLHRLEQKNVAFTTLEKDGFEISSVLVEGNDLSHHNLSYCGFNVTMRRILMPYLFHYYLPSAAIVFLSQISFIMPPSSIPGRIGLLAVLLLTLLDIFMNHVVSIVNQITCLLPSIIFIYLRIFTHNIFILLIFVI